MFRKLHSNRDPRDTLLREIKKEFSVYFGQAESGIRSVLGRYPRQAFGCMVFLMLVSLVLSFTVFRNREQAVVTVGGPAAVPVRGNSPGVLAPVGSGFSQILQTTATLKQTLELKQRIDTLLAKGRLSQSDSVQLAASLDELQRLQRSINPKR